MAPPQPGGPGAGPAFVRTQFEQMYRVEDPYGIGNRWLLERRRLAILGKLIEGRTFDRGLDLGSGEGHVARVLLPHMRRLVCVEFAHPAAQRLRKTLEGPAAAVVQADMARLALRPAAFDFVCASLCLEYVPDRARMLDTIATWLRPGGTLLVVGAVIRGYFKYAELVKLVADRFEIRTVTPVSSRLLLAKLANRPWWPFREPLYDAALRVTGWFPRACAKHVAVLATRQPA